MNAFTIPAWFLIEGETEGEAAQCLSDILERCNLTQDHIARASDGRAKDLGPIQSWSLPNHPLTSVEDSVESVLIFAPTMHNESHLPPRAQQIADFAVKFWSHIVDANANTMPAPPEAPTDDAVIAAFTRGIVDGASPVAFDTSEETEAFLAGAQLGQRMYDARR